MTEFSENTCLYEIVMRVREDGSYGAHYQNITRFSRDGVVFSATEGPLVPLIEGDAAVFAVLEQFVGAAAAATLAANQVLQANNQELLADSQELKARIGELQEALAAATPPPAGGAPE